MGKKRKLTKEETRAINAAKPALNRSMQAARRLKGRIKVYDPQFMI